MSEVVRLRDVSQRPQEDALFEALKAGLREHSRDRRLTKVLGERTRQSEDALAAAYADTAVTPDDRHVVEREYALNIMALQPMVAADRPPHNPLGPAFMKFGRSRLAERMLRSPADRNLRGSVFFASSDRQRRFAASVSSAVTPYGDYDERAFAEAVVAGEFDSVD